tara:strand:+ start:5055 stop:5519 length:465 start_codon:yes stop_codon:yes gene_type:complete
MKNHEKIFNNFKLLRPLHNSKIYIDELNKKEKLSLARYVRIWGYINALSLEFAKDLKLDINNKKMLLDASILIHMAIFDYTEKKTFEIYKDMYKTLNSLNAWKESFSDAAKEAMLDILNIRNKIRVDDVEFSLSNFPRLDHRIKSFCEHIIADR